jgi:hypothetical protein
VKRSVRKIAGKRTLKPSSAPANGVGLDEVFSALRGLLAPYENSLALKVPKPGYCYVESRTPTYKNRPMYFAGIGTGKNYVSYYLMSVNSSPEFVQTMSLGLKKHMHGKACFKFTEVDPELLRELARLTEAGYHRFKSMKYL